MRVDRAQVAVGRDDVNVVRLQQRVLADLLNGKRDVRLQQLRHVALVVGRKMNHDHKRQAAIGGHVLKNVLSAASPPAEAPIPTTAGFGFDGDSGFISTVLAARETA